MSIKKAYYYLFYKFYRFGEWSPSIFPSSFTAVFAIAKLETFLFVALKFYYIEFVDPNDTFTTSLSTFVILGLIILVNYVAFIKDDTWKKYVKEFDRWPKMRNKVGTWLVVGFVVFVIANLALSIHIMAEKTGIR